jgi:hypothetical protein
MTLLSALASHLADPFVLVLWCAIAIVFAVNEFPWERQDRLVIWWRSVRARWREIRSEVRDRTTGGGDDVVRRLHRLRIF